MLRRIMSRTATARVSHTGDQLATHCGWLLPRRVRPRAHAGGGALLGRVRISGQERPQRRRIEPHLVVVRAERRDVLLLAGVRLVDRRHACSFGAVRPVLEAGGHAAARPNGAHRASEVIGECVRKRAANLAVGDDPSGEVPRMERWRPGARNRRTQARPATRVSRAESRRQSPPLLSRLHPPVPHTRAAHVH